MNYVQGMPQFVIHNSMLKKFKYVCTGMKCLLFFHSILSLIIIIIIFILSCAFFPFDIPLHALYSPSSSILNALNWLEKRRTGNMTKECVQHTHQILHGYKRTVCTHIQKRIHTSWRWWSKDWWKINRVFDCILLWRGRMVIHHNRK